MNILLTSAGRRSYLVQYFIDALDGRGKVIAANSAACPAFYRADDSVITPLIYDSRYIPFLLDYCQNNAVDLLIPLFDVDIPVLAKSKPSFEAIGTQVIAPGIEIAEICNDKLLTVNYLKKRGFDVPVTLNSLEDALDHIKNGNIAYPLFIKPRWGMGSIGVHEARNEATLRAAWILTEDAIGHSYLKYESQEDKDHGILVQEKLEGEEYGLDVICDLSGTYESTIVKKKLAMRSGETDSAIVVRSEALEQLGKRLAEACPHPGNMDVDVFVSGDRCVVLELNARFGGGYPFSHASGVNLPLAIIEWSLGNEIPARCLASQGGTFSYKEIGIVTPEVNKRVSREASYG
ncbi:ATP-grasp domain-containing protein [Eggerthella timonensis]|uniref:ATP-grasp domain-containing protein n=1 Tax=Eggerthella timonensis TaxID=1871008 RepID=UPI000C7832FB|nr:ATP-grasp domain-containing protein [Eggerthella timonensis]